MSTNFFIFLIVSVIAVRGEDGIGFPEVHEDLNSVPADNRSPLFMPGRCQENELLFPGDQNDDWICDCKPGYLFHPGTSKCHPAFEQGPCAERQILVLPEKKKSFVPVCVVNTCSKKKNVLFEKKCVTLGKPCRVDTRYVYGVNATTIKVQCLMNPLSFPVSPYTAPPPTADGIRDRFAEDPASEDQQPLIVMVGAENLCTPGCKRRIEGTCPKP